MNAVLETRALSKSFGAVVAAAEIDLVVGEREVIGVIGANGAGKTTFINMVTGYLRPSGGSIRFRGRDITGLPPRQVVRAGICRSFQVSQLFRELTVLDNMLIALGMLREGALSWLAPLHTRAREDEARKVLERYTIERYADSRVATLPQGVRKLLERYTIERYADSRVATLPQGVRKLLDIAMATVSEPPLLLLDEPTSGVAAEEKFALMDTVMAPVRASGAACLFVEHDMEIVERYSARVIAFYDGRILADGPTAETLTDPEVRKYVIGAELHRDREAGCSK